jgi:iron complex transport system permease protein
MTGESAPVEAAGCRSGSLDRLDFGERRRLVILVCLSLALFASAALAMFAGAYDLGASKVFQVIAAHLLHHDTSAVARVHDTVVWSIRLPRIIVAVLAGFALSAAGSAYQATFRNPLVDPFVLGVSAGASLGASLAILHPHIFMSVQAAAFVFALLAVGISYLASRANGANSTVTLILSGVIVSSVLQSLVAILKYTSDDSALRAIVFWIMGGFYYAGWSDVASMTPVVLSGFAALWVLSWKLNVLSMGDDEARTLGVNPERLKLVFVLIATLMTGTAVASAGIIAWVGLMTPHAARMVLGPDHRFVIPAAAVMAGGYLLICDTVARTLTGAEIPISIVTSILGAPYLFYLLRSRAARGAVTG